MLVTVISMIRLLLVALIGFVVATHEASASAADFLDDVQPFLTTYCAGCHNAQDYEGKLSLLDYAALQQGGEHGAVVVPGKAEASRLWQVLQPDAENKMPPKGSPQPTEEDLQVVRTWIDGGAAAPVESTSSGPMPSVQGPAVSLAPKPITALAVQKQWLAVGRYGEIDVLTTDLQFIRRFDSLSGKVNAIEFFPDQTRFVAVGGSPGQVGSVWLVDIATGEVTRLPQAHDDALYAVAINVAGSRMATAGYDRKIQIWDVTSAQVVQTLTGHNGPVFDLAFGPDGCVLASARGDATIKVWDTT